MPLREDGSEGQPCGGPGQWQSSIFFPEVIVNKGVPTVFVTLLAGVGLGLALSKLLKQPQPRKRLLKLPVRVEPLRQRNRLAMNRLKGCLDVERN